jgi:salicylate hydroxylase
VGDDLEAFKKDAVTRMDWIWDHEIAQDLERAKEMMMRDVTNTP